MAKLSTKHASRNIGYTDFTGGINTSLPSELIKENEMQMCNNYELNLSGEIKTRGGISPSFLSFDHSIIGTFYDYEMNSLLVFVSNGDIYISDFATKTKIGTTTGLKKPMCCKFGGRIIIASGGKLQSYDYTLGLKTISKDVTWFDNTPVVDDSPVSDICFVRFGRIVTAKIGDDYLRYSGFGDEANWTENEINIIKNKIDNLERRQLRQLREIELGIGDIIPDGDTITPRQRLQNIENNIKDLRSQLKLLGG